MSRTAHVERAPTRSTWRSVVCAVLGVLWLIGVSAFPASAHLALGQPGHFRTTVTGLRPATAGLGVSATAAGNLLAVTNDTHETVTVLGYKGEPYLRLTGTRVWENMRSPTTYQNQTMTIRSAPAGADATASPQWRVVSWSDRAEFHDHRVHWGGGAMPQAVKRYPYRRHLIKTWTVQLLLGRSPVTVTGTLTWQPTQSVLGGVLVIGGSVLTFALVAFYIVRTERRGEVAP
jgi:hypothetical protein